MTANMVIHDGKVSLRWHFANAYLDVTRCQTQVKAATREGKQL